MPEDRLYYYIDQDNQQQGPFTVEQLSEQQINVNTLVWSEGMESWIPAGQVQELSALFTGQPVPPPFQPAPPSFGNAQNSPMPPYPTGGAPKKSNVWLIALLVGVGVFAFIGIGIIIFTGVLHQKSIEFSTAKNSAPVDTAVTVDVPDTATVGNAVAETHDDEAEETHNTNVHHLTGYINKYPIDMVIHMSANGDITGEYTYVKHPSFGTMQLEGYRSENGRVYLAEYPPANEGSQITGEFEGYWYGNKISGTFIRTADDKQMNFSLTE